MLNVASMASRKGEGSKECVIEYYVTLLVDKHATSPKKSEVFYDKDTALIRLSSFSNAAVCILQCKLLLRVFFRNESMNLYSRS
jgi:hypothetical protein